MSLYKSWTDMVVDFVKTRGEAAFWKEYGSIEKILPSNIVIYYSGLADIMKKICSPHDEKLSVNYRKGNTAIHRPFFYFEPSLFSR
mgnify:CR=1 FL=1